MSTAGEQPKELLSSPLLCVRISRDFRTHSESGAFAAAKGFLVLEKVLLFTVS